ncbi:MAG: hypothetical protein VKI42_00170 [Synechococcaceae cyanobacterium]|jgi:hypothetical protein|nr:hypothetical protein [Synechococcaceae cyanobacterium]
MSTPQTLVQAALNRLSARLGSGLVDAAASFAVLAQDAPDRLRHEWDLFREEVEMEAQRLERGDGEPSPDGAHTTTNTEDPQQQIDRLRAQVARVARRLEEQP